MPPRSMCWRSVSHHQQGDHHGQEDQGARDQARVHEGDDRCGQHPHAEADRGLQGGRQDDGDRDDGVPGECQVTHQAVATRPGDGSIGWKHSASWASVSTSTATGGSVGRALVGCLPATGAEAAARRRVERGGDLARQDDVLAARGVVERRGRRHQRRRVGVQRALERGLGGALLDHPAEVHHDDPVGDVPHDRQVVGDEHVGRRPSSCWSSLSRLSTCAWTDRSSAETGSSQTITSGLRARARAMPSRWRCPPENSWGYLSASEGRRPDEVQQLAHPRRPVPGGLVEARGGSATAPTRCRRADIRGVQRGEGVLEDHLHPATERQQVGSRSADRGPRRRTRTVPLVGALEHQQGPAPGWTCRSPDSPTRPSVSPRCRAKLTPSRALTALGLAAVADREDLRQVADLEQRSRSSVHLVGEVAGGDDGRGRPRAARGASYGTRRGPRAAVLVDAGRGDGMQLGRGAADRLQLASRARRSPAPRPAAPWV